MSELAQEPQLHKHIVSTRTCRYCECKHNRVNSLFCSDYCLKQWCFENNREKKVNPFLGYNEKGDLVYV